jgi:PST family polysaccharide transporter
MVTGILGFILAMIRFKIAWHWPSPREIGTELVEGWQIFVSMLSTSLYTMSNAFILGIFTNNTMVGYYSAGEKVVKGIQGLLAPLSQTIYPHVSRLTLESRESAFRFLRKMIRLVGSTTFIGSLILFILAHPIGIFILGNNFQESILVIRCLAFLPFLVALSNIFGVQIMLNFGLKNLFMRILIMAGILDIILAILLGPTLKYIGISIASLITECFVTVTMLIVLIKKRLPVFRES